MEQPFVREVNKKTFWELIAEAKARFDQDIDSSARWLESQLLLLEPQQAQNFNDILHCYLDLSNKYGLWNAASILTDGCSNDGFDYFRGWLIAQGKETFYSALKNPDSLASVAPYEDCQFESLWYVGKKAYEKLTGKDIDTNSLSYWSAYQKLRDELRMEIQYGEGINYPYEWDEIAGYLPSLCEKYLTPEVLDWYISRGETIWFHDNPEVQKARTEGHKDVNKGKKQKIMRDKRHGDYQIRGCCICRMKYGTNPWRW